MDFTKLTATLEKLGYQVVRPVKKRNFYNSL